MVFNRRSADHVRSASPCDSLNHTESIYSSLLIHPEKLKTFQGPAGSSWQTDLGLWSASEHHRAGQCYRSWAAQDTLQWPVSMGRCRFVPGIPHKACAGGGEPTGRGDTAFLSSCTAVSPLPTSWGVWKDVPTDVYSLQVPAAVSNPPKATSGQGERRQITVTSGAGYTVYSA